MKKETQNPEPCQTDFRRRVCPISYSAWFDSNFNKARAFDYMSNRSFLAYKNWCKSVAKRINN
jgi:hypothetical protein